MTQEVQAPDVPEPESPAPAPPPPPSISRDIMSGLLGIGIAVLCLVPPGIHFVSGPLGPAIGGFFAAARIRARGRHAFFVGATIGVGETIAVLAIAAGLIATKQVANDTASMALIAVIDVLVFFYSTTLGTIGAFVGGGGRG